MPADGEITTLLAAISAGEASAVDRLLPIVYEQMRVLARSCLARERPGHTLQPTALVHETYLRLVGSEKLPVRDRGHFLAVAARSMRQILVDHAVRRRAAKRGGDAQRVPLDEAVAAFEARCDDLGALDEALARLATMDPLQCRIVELRFFGGFEMAEVAEAVGLPLRTAEREWSLARGWLREQVRARQAELDS